MKKKILIFLFAILFVNIVQAQNSQATIHLSPDNYEVITSFASNNSSLQTAFITFGPDANITSYPLYNNTTKSVIALLHKEDLAVVMHAKAMSKSLHIIAYKDGSSTFHLSNVAFISWYAIGIQVSD
jgi:hypothetical protein